MKRLIIQTVIFALFPFIGYSQHELSVYGGGGLSGLHYKATAGHPKSGFGAQFGLGYRFFFSSELGAGVNIGISQYKTNFHAENINFACRATDFEGVEFDFRSSVGGYEEKQEVAFLQIPLVLQYHTGNYYVAGGVKAGIPLGGKYGSTAATLKSSGYYIEENHEYTSPKFMGFGTFSDIDSKGDLDFKTAFSITLESGLNIKLDGNLSLYVGVYFDYGLNSTIDKTSSLQFVEYNTESPTDFALNSVASSQYAQNKQFAEKISPVAFGVKASLALGIGNSWRTRR